MDRELTRAYVRIKRDGKYKSIDISDFTEQELEDYLKDATKERVYSILKIYHNTLKRIAEDFDIVCSSADLEEQ